MIKVIVVDDEDFARAAIMKKVPWTDMGLEIVGEASNGAQALALVERHGPQIMITDVSMPRMDGIELAAQARKAAPALRVIFVSGYDRFEYVKSAIRIGVSAYLLKPIDSAELQSLLEEISGDLRLEDILHHQSELYARQLEESKPLLRDRLLLSITEGGVRQTDAERYRYLGISLGAAPYTAIQVRVSKENHRVEFTYEKWETIKLMIARRISDIMPDECVVNAVWRSETELNLILGLKSKGTEPRPGKYIESAQKALSEVMACTGMRAAASIGESVNAEKHISASFHQARQAMALRTYIGYGHVITWKDQNGGERAWDGAYSDWEADIVRTIRGGVPEKIEELIDMIFSEIVEYTMRLGLIRAIAFNMTASALRVLGEMDDTPSVISVGRECGWWSMLEEGNTVPEIKAAVLSALLETAEKVRLLHNSHADLIAAQVIERIHAAYAEKLTLQSIAAELHFTPDWVGVIFRKKTGQSFSEYLAGVRMNRAMALLRETDKAVYEIAESVGYQNVPYFSSTFKNTTGMSPRTYRNQLGLCPENA